MREVADATPTGHAANLAGLAPGPAAQDAATLDRLPRDLLTALAQVAPGPVSAVDVEVLCTSHGVLPGSDALSALGA
ncbi:hypothetical protein AB0L30_30350 [Microbispora rosea]|uniref:hypothetical protein n=1 Tax=Microbispora rosea TaxID=58117 RepID=UPI0034483EC4